MVGVDVGVGGWWVSVSVVTVVDCAEAQSSGRWVGQSNDTRGGYMDGLGYLLSSIIYSLI